MYKDENNSNSASGPVGPRSNGISPIKIIFIILLCFIVLLAYKTYTKISGFLSFVSGEIDSVSSSIQHSVFSTSGPIPLDDEDEDGMIVNDNPENGSDNVLEEDEGDEATREELPISEEEKNNNGKPPAELSNNTASGNAKNNSAPVPFPRRLNPFEDSLMNVSDGTSGGNYKSVKIDNGYFAGFSKLTLKNEMGITQFVYKDSGIYQYAFFPPEEEYSDDGNISKRIGMAEETFRVLYDRVYGTGSYAKNKNSLLKEQMKFSGSCGMYTDSEWNFVSVDGYSYGCNKYGFTVIPDNAADKQGILSGDPSEIGQASLFARRLKKAKKLQQEMQRSGNASQMDSIYYKGYFEVPLSSPKQCKIRIVGIKGSTEKDLFSGTSTPGGKIRITRLKKELDKVRFFVDGKLIKEEDVK